MMIRLYAEPNSLDRASFLDSLNQDSWEPGQIESVYDELVAAGMVKQFKQGKRARQHVVMPRSVRTDIETMQYDDVRELAAALTENIIPQAA